jgi:hypothetical protein
MGKGRKQRTVPLWQSTVSVVRAWKRRMGATADSAPLFPNWNWPVLAFNADDPTLLAQLDCNQDADNGIITCSRRGGGETDFHRSLLWLVVVSNTEWYHHAGPRTPVPDCIGSI